MQFVTATSSTLVVVYKLRVLQPIQAMPAHSEDLTKQVSVVVMYSMQDQVLQALAKSAPSQVQNIDIGDQTAAAATERTRHGPLCGLGQACLCRSTATQRSRPHKQNPAGNMLPIHRPPLIASQR